MSSQDETHRTTVNSKKLEEKSLLGSAYSFHDKGQISSQTAAELQADDSDD